MCTPARPKGEGECKNEKFYTIWNDARSLPKTFFPIISPCGGNPEGKGGGEDWGGVKQLSFGETTGNVF
ncbi:hypothetical protein FACS189429_0560 [Bacteroidia bacterium]|nr:hypothetical protein FACS189429_0560 [Bacteroidia bacterium]